MQAPYEPNYPQTRAQATAALMACRQYAVHHVMQALQAAPHMLDSRGRLIKRQVEPSGCTFTGGVSGAAKCDTLEGLGRAMHTAEDFYSHTNWADEADPTKVLSIDNPPGLNRTDLASLFDYDATPVIPETLTGGCYRLIAKWQCNGHVTHETINKDEGTINARSGATSNPRTERGRVGSNFAKAVAMAIREARRQWHWFDDALVKRYGQRRADLMICALTHDHPYEECQLKLTLTGTQTVRWTMNIVDTGTCAGTVTGSGTTVARFTSSKPVYASPIELIAPDSGAALTHGVKIPTTARFSSDGQTHGTGKPCGMGTGPATPPDCGPKTAELPLEVVSLAADELTLRNWTHTNDPYVNCPNGTWQRTRIGPDVGMLYDDDLFDDTVGEIDVIGHGNHSQDQTFVSYNSHSTYTARVTIDWTLTLQRAVTQP
jgi:hypothetical protein